MFPETVPTPVHSPVSGFTVINQLTLVRGPLLSPKRCRIQSTSKVVSDVVTVIPAPAPALIKSLPNTEMCGPAGKSDQL